MIPADPEREVQDQRYNHDLLLEQVDKDGKENKEDQERAKRNFSDVYHVLDFPELREKFKEADRTANWHRKVVRWVGLLAICLSAVALVKTATAPAFPVPPDASAVHRYTDVAVEVVGLVGLILALGGVLIYRRKSLWLRNRLMTERLRQFHFQVLARQWPAVIASCQTETKRKEFLANRRQWLADFLYDYKGKYRVRLSEVLGRPSDRHCWIVPAAAHETAPIADAPKDLIHAYRKLRLEHQLEYCKIKLSNEHDTSVFNFLAWPLKTQEVVLRYFSSFLIFISLIASACLIVGNLFDIRELREEWITVVTVATFVLGAAIRAVEEGLAIGPELNRYEDYEAEIESLLSRFDAATTGAAVRAVIAEMERVSYLEMREFLRANQKTRFVL